MVAVRDYNLTPDTCFDIFREYKMKHQVTFSHYTQSGIGKLKTFGFDKFLDTKLSSNFAKCRARL